MVDDVCFSILQNFVQTTLSKGIINAKATLVHAQPPYNIIYFGGNNTLRTFSLFVHLFAGPGRTLFTARPAVAINSTINWQHCLSWP